MQLNKNELDIAGSICRFIEKQARNSGVTTLGLFNCLVPLAELIATKTRYDKESAEYWWNENLLSKKLAEDLSKTLELYRDFEERVSSALDSVPMATDEPADVNIISMRDRITALKDKTEELELKLKEVRYILEGTLIPSIVDKNCEFKDELKQLAYTTAKLASISKFTFLNQPFIFPSTDASYQKGRKLI